MAFDVHNPDTAAQLLTLIPTLRGLGFTRVVVAYSGGGDSGQVDDVQLTPRLPISPELRDKLEELAWDISPDGFGNGDGGEGTVTLDVVAGTLEHMHADFYTSRDETTHSYDLETIADELAETPAAETTEEE